tara:strand:- start:477 stop:632 length:156 start_codon:yes stop_codon:yes gene_type:complete
MRAVFYIFILTISFSQNLNSNYNTINQLKIALETASRTGQVIWAEEFSGLT